jgi:hypothetical protein
LPFLLTDRLGLGDTLNHLARIHILTDIGRSADLQRFYVRAWAPIPYLAMDAVLPWLARFCGIYVALKIFVCVCVILPVLAVLVLQWVDGRRFSRASGAAFVLGANYNLALGFLNYVFMASVAMLAFAAWVATSAWPKWTRLPVFSLVCLMLYFGHAFGFLAYGCAVAGYEIARAMRTSSSARREALLDLGIAALQAVPVLVFAVTLNTGAGTSGRVYSVWGDITEKLLAFSAPFIFVSDPVQQGVLRASAFGLLTASGAIRFSKALWPAALSTFVVALAVPEILLSTWLTDFRLPFTAAMLCLGAISFIPAPRMKALLSVALCALVAIKSYDVGRLLRRLDAQEAQMHTLLVSLPFGARLLVADESRDPPDGDALVGSTVWNMPLMAVIERDAFVPYLFTGVTTVHVTPAYERQSARFGNPTTLARLTDDLAGRASSLSSIEAREGVKFYWHDWVNRFDYLLVEHFHAPVPASVPGPLKLVAQTAELELFEIKK